MRWRKQPKPALVPGRDRQVKSDSSQRVYSYYAGRPSAGPTRSETSERTVRTHEAAQPQTRRHSGHTAITWACLAIIAVCAAKVVVLVPSAKVVVSQNEAQLRLPTDSYAAAADAEFRRSLLNRNKITFDTNGIAQHVASDHPELTSVVVTAPLIGNRPVVYVAAARPACLLQTPRGNFTVSAEGFILASTSEPVAGLPILKDASSRQVTAGKRYLAGSTVSFVTTVAYQLEKAGFGVEHLVLPASAPYEVDAYLANKPFYIRFNLAAEVMQQSGGAVATLQQLGSTMPAQYVDMRVPGKAYYK